MTLSLFIDLETTGLPAYKAYNQYYPPSQTTYYESSRIVEIAWVLAEVKKDTFTILSSKEFLVFPTFTINNSHIHGITTEDCLSRGVSFIEILDVLKKDIQKAQTVVAHNVLFDYNILLSEVYRVDKNFFNELIEKDLEDTMYIGKNFLKINKFPKLINLFNHFFLEEKIQKHRALDDVMMCLRCYVKMKQEK